MLYRRYQPEDFPTLYEIEECCFQRPHRFSRRYMRQLVQNTNGATWVVVDEAAALAGFAIVEWANTEEGTLAYIETLEVKEAHRRQGVGVALLQHLIQSAQAAGAGALWLHVAEDNQAARRLYQSLGFVEQGREKNYYGRHRDGLVLALLLASADAPPAE